MNNFQDILESTLLEKSLRSLKTKFAKFVDKNRNKHNIDDWDFNDDGSGAELALLGNSTATKPELKKAISELITLVKKNGYETDGEIEWGDGNWESASIWVE